MESTRLGKFKISYHNSKEFHQIKNEIFNSGIYSLEISEENPVILDIGAHIGLATLFFKQRWPGARLFAFEPNPESFALLEENVWQNNLENVELYQLAITGSEGIRQLYIPIGEDSWSSNSSLREGSWTGIEKQQGLRVESVRLAKIIQKLEHIDILKMDVEGAEFEIFKDMKSQIGKISHILVEIHPGNRKALRELRALLESLDYTLSYSQDGKQIKFPDESKLFVLSASQASSK